VKIDNPRERRINIDMRRSADHARFTEGFDGRISLCRGERNGLTSVVRPHELFWRAGNCE
jgi:hypothetical protein